MSEPKFGEWQPIDTAPKKKNIFVTFAEDDIGPGDVGIMIARFDKCYIYKERWHGVYSGWVDSSSGEECELHYGKPTLWMPLPELPK